ncbi:MAG: hypothetical protein CM15mP120_26830 [Pseudomonadota bacterium]|nr:MAG: hypothetical protein CM15mP120_26830 [Pseudomonadota bacterium]
MALADGQMHRINTPLTWHSCNPRLSATADCSIGVNAVSEDRIFNTKRAHIVDFAFDENVVAVFPT